MKRKENICILLIAILFGSCTLNSNIPRVYVSENCSRQVKKVGFTDLMDSLSYYSNTFIEVSGIFQCSFEESALVDSKKRRESGIWIDFDQKLSREENGKIIFLLPSFDEYDKLNNKTVIIRGIVDTSNHGHIGRYRVAVGDVCYIQILK